MASRLSCSKRGKPGALHRQDNDSIRPPDWMHGPGWPAKQREPGSDCDVCSPRTEGLEVSGGRSRRNGVVDRTQEGGGREPERRPPPLCRCGRVCSTWTVPVSSDSSLVGPGSPQIRPDPGYSAGAGDAERLEIRPGDRSSVSAHEACKRTRAKHSIARRARAKAAELNWRTGKPPYQRALPRSSLTRPH